jgi:WD domain, G-beta repeat
MADLSQRVGANVTVDDLDAWNWTDETYSDAGIGCPQPGISYAQTFTRGYTFSLTYNGVFFDYRSPRGSTTFWLCNTPDLTNIQEADTPTSVPASNDTSTGTSSEIPDSDYFPCPAALTGSVGSRFDIGFEGRFVGTIALSIRAEASRTADSVGTIQTGNTFSVVGGPACDPTFTWWQVDTGSAVGWLPEVDPSNLSYWLEPTSGSSLPVVPLPSAGIPASRQVIAVTNAEQVSELARQTIESPQHILAGSSFTNPEGIVVIATSENILVYSAPSPESPLETIPSVVAEMVISPDESAGIIGVIAGTSSSKPGIGFYSTTGGGGGGGSVDFTVTTGVALIPDLNLLAIGSENSVLLYDIQSQQVAAELPQSITPSALAVSSAKNILAVALPPDQVVLWDVSTRTQIATLSNPLSLFDTGSLAFSPDGRYLAVSTTGGSVNIWNVETLQGFISLPAYGGGGEVFHVVYSPDGSLIATAGGPPPVEGNITDTFSLHIWDANTGSLLQAIPLTGFTEGLAFSDDATLLYSIGRDNIWQVWGLP